MKQFYEIYKDDEKVSTLLTQLSWSNHLKIISGSKSKEEREFYINLAINENLTNRELVRRWTVAIMSVICFQIVIICLLYKG